MTDKTLTVDEALAAFPVPTDAEKMQALAAKLVRLSDELHIAAEEIGAIGWAGHAAMLRCSASNSSICAQQLRNSDKAPGCGT